MMQVQEIPVCGTALENSLEQRACDRAEEEDQLEIAR